MATAVRGAVEKRQEVVFEWEGKDKNGKIVRGEMRAGSEGGQRQPAAPEHPDHQGQEGLHQWRPWRSKQKDIAIFTRQLAAMMKASVPLQSFDYRRARQH